MTAVWGGYVCLMVGRERNAGVLHCAQNDKQRQRQRQMQVSPLRFASVEMTKSWLHKACGKAEADAKPGSHSEMTNKKTNADELMSWLFVAEGFYGVQVGGFPGGVDAEDQADGAGA